MSVTNQDVFVGRLAEDTGLSPRVLKAQALAEEPSAHATTRGDQNWLNVGQDDSGPTADAAQKALQSDPIAAADYTATWMATKASPGIKAILKTKGKSDTMQIAAIGSSGWATNPAYGSTIRKIYGTLGSYKAEHTTTGGILPIVTGAAGGAASAVGDAASSVVSPFASIAKTGATLIGDLLSPSFWLHVLEVIGGLILVVMGIRTLTGNTGVPGPVKEAAAAAVVA